MKSDERNDARSPIDGDFEPAADGERDGRLRRLPCLLRYAVRKDRNHVFRSGLIERGIRRILFELAITPAWTTAIGLGAGLAPARSAIDHHTAVADRADLHSLSDAVRPLCLGGPDRARLPCVNDGGWR